jgi:hypothetical protein
MQEVRAMAIGALASFTVTIGTGGSVSVTRAQPAKLAA